MEREEVSQKVISILKDKAFSGPTDDVEESARFKEDLEGDSLDMIEVVMEIEREFDITINDEELFRFNNEGTKVSEIIDFTFNKIKERDARGKDMLRHRV